MIKICEDCGAPNDEFAKRCMFCGKSFVTEKEIIHVKKRKSFVKKLLWISLALFIVLYFGVFVIGSNINSPTKIIESYFSLIQSENYSDAMGKFSIIQDEFNTDESFGKYCKETYGEKPSIVNLKRAKKSQEENSRTYKVELSNGYIGSFTVHKDGKRLFIYDKWKMDAPENLYSKSISIFAPQGIEIFINGSKISEDYASTETVPSGYGGLDNKALAPNMKSYKIDKLIAMPNVTGKKDGHDCPGVINDNSVSFSAPIDKTTEDKYRQFALTVAKTYANYITNDIKFGGISKYLIPESEVYRNLKGFYAGWTAPHKTPVISDISYYDMCVYDNTHYSIGVKFTYFIDSTHNDQTLKINYKMFFVKIGNTWKVAAVTPITTPTK